MTILPHPWGAYARLQIELSRNTRSDHSWGAEAGLDYIIDAVADLRPANDDDIARAVETGGRRERHRTAIGARRYPGVIRRDRASRRLLSIEPFVEPHAMLEARSEVRHIQAHVAGSDWGLMQSLGAGYEYTELAPLAGSSSGALRARVLRVRRHLRSL